MSRTETDSLGLGDRSALIWDIASVSVGSTTGGFMKFALSAALLASAAVALPGSADAAVITRSFNVTASQFMNFSGQPVPFTNFSADLKVTYDDSRSGFFGPPDLLRIVTDGQVNAGPFSAAPVAGYFAPGGMNPNGRIGVGGALNGGNVGLPGTNDFYITFDANNVAFGSVSFNTAAQAGAFLSAGAIVRETTTVAAVPEPQTWIMLLAGFGFLGAAIRRGRRVVVHA
jgi:hypothetical protein